MKYRRVCLCLLALLLLLSLLSCVETETPLGDEGSTKETGESVGVSEGETVSESVCVSTNAQESVREPVEDGFPNEAESDGTLRY